MHSPLLGEFLGTMILILLGDGVVAAVVLKHSKAHDSGWIVITAGWAFAVMAGVLTAMACGGDGHLNPAVTLGFAVYTGSYTRLFPTFLRSFSAPWLAPRSCGCNICCTGARQKIPRQNSPASALTRPFAVSSPIC